MSRQDQYIGLTKKARELMDKIIRNPKSICETHITCYTAFGDFPIYGDKITLCDRIYQEEIQCIPWSSGPMYFLHIGVYNSKTGNIIGYIGDWEYDEHLFEKEHLEFDYEKGTLSV